MIQRCSSSWLTQQLEHLKKTGQLNPLSSFFWLQDQVLLRTRFSCTVNQLCLAGLAFFL